MAANLQIKSSPFRGLGGYRPVPVGKNVFTLTGNLPVALKLPVITLAAERCSSGVIW